MHYGDLERMFGVFPMIFTALVCIIVIALFLYARAQTAKGVLRYRCLFREDTRPPHIRDPGEARDRAGACFREGETPVFAGLTLIGRRQPAETRRPPADQINARTHL